MGHRTIVGKLYVHVMIKQPLAWEQAALVPRPNEPQRRQQEEHPKKQYQWLSKPSDV